MQKSRRTLIAGNWKMNGLRRDGGALAEAVAALDVGDSGPEILVCPPATLIGLVGEKLAGSAVRLGAQDCHAKPSGAYTGDIAAPMLADFGCAYVIVGHSERRALHGESSAEVRAKAEAALAAGLKPIVCVGETEQERDAGRMLEVVTGQIAESLPGTATPETIVVAYEPVWAIGTGRTPSIDEIAFAHAAIRAKLAAQLPEGAGIRILYGGSVKPSNAQEILALEDVDGALVGGASLKIEDFAGIIAAAG